MVHLAEPGKAVNVLAAHKVQLLAPTVEEYVPLRHSGVLIEPPPQDEPIGQISVEPLPLQ